MFGRNVRAQRRLFNIAWLVSVVALYAMIMPPGGHDSASAHVAPSYWNVVGKNPSGTYPHLDWWNQNTQYADQVNVAKLQWNALGGVIIGNTVVSAKTDVFVFDGYDCNRSWVGRYYWPNYNNNGVPYGQIEFNECIMSWEGGYAPWRQADAGPATERARRRVAVHEFGHAMGLNHSDESSPVISDQCQTVMTAGGPIDQEVCYQPKAHDSSDMRALHPDAYQ
jgi:hypothetical protein